MSKSVKPAKQYNEAFKRQAVESWIRSSRPGTQIARELGISYPAFKDWRRRYSGESTPEGPDLNAEVRMLRAELARVREQRDILKKRWASSRNPNPVQPPDRSDETRAFHCRNPAPKLLYHSDRGVQYACKDFRAVLQSANLVASMSRKGNCYDNAAMESFWSIYKNECIYADPEYPTRSDAIAATFDRIEVFYNRIRHHSSLGYQSPVDFENLNH